MSDVDDFFAAPPTENEEAWGLVHWVQHCILSKDENATVEPLTPQSSLLDLVRIARAAGIRVLEKCKPLRWRMGPVPEGLQDKEYLIRNINLCGGYRHRVGRGHSLTYGEEYIPLSDILALVDEE